MAKRELAAGAGLAVAGKGWGVQLQPSSLRDTRGSCIETGGLACPLGGGRRRRRARASILTVRGWACRQPH
eukprot:359613-Chlamydomonas_euryale.AAC.4